MVIDSVQFEEELATILDVLVDELRSSGSQLIAKRKDGPTHIQICCPYHNDGMERRPSAGIRKEDGMFHCFACGEVHTLPEVISHCFGQDDGGAYGWKWLLRHFISVSVKERKDVLLDMFRDNGNSVSGSFGMGRDVDDTGYSEYVSEKELDQYRYIHPYMYKRGLTDEIIELFDVGYDAATESLTFPVKDSAGRCLFIARRSVKTKFFNYPAGVEKPLYGLYELYKQNVKFDSVIVCESMLDALSFWTVGKYALALNGLGNELQFRQLRELPCRKIILATDMDERGLAARKRIRLNLHNIKIVTEYFFPSGRKDANDCTKEELLQLQEYFC